MLSRISHYLSLLIPSNIVELYMGLKMPVKAALFVHTRFDKLAPKPARIASGNHMMKKWDFLGASKFLLNCKPETAVAILNQFYNNKKLKSIPSMPPIFIKPGIILNLMLTVPYMAFGLKEEEKKERVEKIITLVAGTNKDLLKERFEKGPLNASVTIMEIKNPDFMAAFVPFMTFDIELSRLAVLLFLLEEKNPDQFKNLLDRLPSERALEVRGKIKEIKESVVEHEVKMSELNKLKSTKNNKKMVRSREEKLTELFDKLAKFIDQFIKSDNSDDDDKNSSGEQSQAEAAPENS